MKKGTLAIKNRDFIKNGTEKTMEEVTRARPAKVKLTIQYRGTIRISRFTKYCSSPFWVACIITKPEMIKNNSTAIGAPRTTVPWPITMSVEATARRT